MTSLPMRRILYGAAATAVLLALSAASAAAGDETALGWTEVGPPSARFAPAPAVRLGTLQTRDLLGPVTIVRPAKPYDLELFSPHLTGTPAAPAQAVVDPLHGRAPLMAQGVE